MTEPQLDVVASSDDGEIAENSDTRKKIRKGAAYGLGACAVLLLVDDLVRRFQRRKTVTIAAAVDDKPAS